MWFVSPAYRRYEVTRMVLAQRRWLCDELARRGHEAEGVIVADDDNLDIARYFGFHALGLDNEGLARRFNAGYHYAAEQGAELFVHVGSDDWVHPDVFEGDLSQPQTRRRISYCDLGRGKLVTVTDRGYHGAIPWLIPRDRLAPTRFMPLDKPNAMTGIESSLSLVIPDGWQQQDTHELACVDFKSEVNINRYDATAALASGPEVDAWQALATRYPAELVELAERTSHELYDHA